MRELNQKDLGNRLKYFRELRGFSQNDLSKKIGISRSSLTQIELGNRQVNIMELVKFTKFLGCKLEDLMAFGFDNGVKSDFEMNNKTCSLTPKSENLLLYILEKCAGKPNVGETVLYKILYFMDFDYYQTHKKKLLGLVYKKLPFGPVPNNLDRKLNEMEGDKKILIFKTEYFGYLQTRYLPLVKSDTKYFKDDIEFIDTKLNKLSDLSAKEISDKSHKDIPWLVTADLDIIDYDLASKRSIKKMR